MGLTVSMAERGTGGTVSSGLEPGSLTSLMSLISWVTTRRSESSRLDGFLEKKEEEGVRWWRSVLRLPE